MTMTMAAGHLGPLAASYNHERTGSWRLIRSKAKLGGLELKLG